MSLQAHQSNRVCNALALLQCVASHPETRSAFLQGKSQVSCAFGNCVQCIAGVLIEELKNQTFYTWVMFLKLPHHTKVIICKSFHQVFIVYTFNWFKLFATCSVCSIIVPVYVCVVKQFCIGSVIPYQCLEKQRWPTSLLFSLASPIIWRNPHLVAISHPRNFFYVARHNQRKHQVVYERELHVYMPHVSMGELWTCHCHLVHWQIVLFLCITSWAAAAAHNCAASKHSMHASSYNSQMSWCRFV